MSERKKPAISPEAAQKRLEQLRDAAAPHFSKALGVAANKAHELSQWLEERQQAIDAHTMTPDQENDRNAIMKEAPQTD